MKIKMEVNKMKSFAQICKLNQFELKTYLRDYLKENNYKNPIYDDGYLYAKGTVPVLLVAHLDTVHHELPKNIIDMKGRMSAVEGIGADDRCGVFMIMNIIREFNCSVLFCEDEEKGGIGAKKFCKTDYINNLEVNYMIEFDRKNGNDAVFYSCDNKDFTDFVLKETRLAKAYGSFSDISILAPKAKIAAVNISCGYYNPHTKDEYVIYGEMLNNIERAKDLIIADCNKPFEYIAQKYEYKYNAKDFTIDKYISDLTFMSSNKKAKSKHVDDLMLELEVVAEIDGTEQVYYATGNTKAECWADLFLNYTNICYDDITDYSFI